jgi:hypothetical protein
VSKGACHDSVSRDYRQKEKLKYDPEGLILEV